MTVIQYVDDKKLLPVLESIFFFFYFFKIVPLFYKKFNKNNYFLKKQHNYLSFHIQNVLYLQNNLNISSHNFSLSILFINSIVQLLKLIITQVFSVTFRAMLRKDHFFTAHI